MTMNYKPQTFGDVTSTPPTADSVQLKYDGWWSRVVFSGGFYKTYSKTDRLVDEGGPFNSVNNCILIAEYLFGTQWAQDPQWKGRYAVFDLVEYEHGDLTAQPYHVRLGAAKQLITSLGRQFFAVPTLPIAQRDRIWRTEVETDRYEGLVYRESQAPYSTKLYRQKPRVTKFLRAVDFVEGQGKHEGRLGAILAVDTDDDSGPVQKVGGGFSDEVRQEIWDNQAAYRGRWFEAEGRKLFESGSLRHPNFTHWR